MMIHKLKTCTIPARGTVGPAGQSDLTYLYKYLLMNCNYASLQTLINIFFSELMSNPKLQNLLYMVLVAGNFLNSVS